MRRIFLIICLCFTASAQIVSMSVSQPGAGATAAGTYVGVRDNHQYLSVICTAGTPDTVKFNREGGAYTACVPITGTAQMLSYPAGTISAATWSSGVATFTDTAHGLTGGALLTITGAAPSGYNVTACAVTVIDANTLSCSVISNPGSYTSGGTATASDGLTITWSTTTGHAPGTPWHVSVNGNTSSQNFLARGVGATGLPAQEKLGQIVNADDFGGSIGKAVAAITQAGAQGGIIRLSRNTVYDGAVPPLPVLPITIEGEGDSSQITCTGAACITLTYAHQLVRNLSIRDSNPAGNANTVGLLVDGGTVIAQVNIENVSLYGGKSPVSGFLGRGLVLKGVVALNLYNVISAFWDRGGQTVAAYGTAINNLHVFGGAFVANATWNFDNTGGGDVSFSGTDIENGCGGLLINGRTHIDGGHFEAGAPGGACPTGTDIEALTGSYVTTAGNEIIGGVLKIDSGAVFKSSGDYVSDPVIDNGSAVFEFPFLGLGGGVTGSVGAIYSDFLGWHCAGTGCSASNYFSWNAPYLAYRFNSQLQALSGFYMAGNVDTGSVHLQNSGYGDSPRYVNITQTGAGTLVNHQTTTGGADTYFFTIDGVWNGLAGSPGGLQSSGPCVLASPLNTPVLLCGNTQYNGGPGVRIVGGVDAISGFSKNGVPGITATLNLTKAGGGACTVTLSGGIAVASTC